MHIHTYHTHTHTIPYICRERGGREDDLPHQVISFSPTPVSFPLLSASWGISRMAAILPFFLFFFCLFFPSFFSIEGFCRKASKTVLGAGRLRMGSSNKSSGVLFSLFF